jgi:hypothetical protein
MSSTRSFSRYARPSAQLGTCRPTGAGRRA